MIRDNLGSFSARCIRAVPHAFLTAALSLTLAFSSQSAQAAPAGDEMRYRESVVRIARENRLDPALLMAVVKVESNFDARARNPDGPLGLTQITPNTARSVQPGIRQVDLLEPEKNLRVGARHLRQLLDQFKDPRMAVAAYQAGVGAVKNTGRGILQHPHTGMHVSKVMREYDSYRRHPAMQTEVGSDNNDRKNLRKASASGAGRSAMKAGKSAQARANSNGKGKGHSINARSSRTQAVASSAARS